ncbi:MAG TPA: choice-of-anchor K domain-containing protein, partial [Thiobacillus sp.]
SWLNGTPGHYKTGVNALDLLLSVQLTESALNDFVFGISIEHTRDEGKKGDPDHLKLIHDFGSFQFNLAGRNYALNFLGLSTDQGETFSDRLSLDEGHKVKAGLYAMITSSQLPPCDPQAVVPVPAAIWLFGSGLLALLGLSRRR